MSTVNPPRASATARELVEVFCTFGPVFQRWLRSRMADADTTFARMRLLRALHVHGSQIMAKLSEELGVTPRNVTALVDGLEREGLVRRTPHPRDRRATIVELTDRGGDVCHAAGEGHQDAMAELFSHLTEDEQRDLLRIMSRLARILHQLDG